MLGSFEDGAGVVHALETAVSVAEVEGVDEAVQAVLADRAEDRGVGEWGVLGGGYEFHADGVDLLVADEQIELVGALDHAHEHVFGLMIVKGLLEPLRDGAFEDELAFEVELVEPVEEPGAPVAPGAIDVDEDVRRVRQDVRDPLDVAVVGAGIFGVAQFVELGGGLGQDVVSDAQAGSMAYTARPSSSNGMTATPPAPANGRLRPRTSL